MMKMKIADSCKPSMKWFGLDQWTVRRTVTMPDEKSVVRTHGGTVIGFYEKDHRGQRVMAIRYQHAGKDYVNMVFVVPPTIDSQPTPLDTVREVCERYGADLEVGDVETKFLIQAEVPLPGPIFEGKFPKDHKVLGQGVMVVTEQRTAHVSLAFALDASEMLEDL